MNIADLLARIAAGDYSLTPAELSAVREHMRNVLAGTPSDEDVTTAERLGDYLDEYNRRVTAREAARSRLAGAQVVTPTPAAPAQPAGRGEPQSPGAGGADPSPAAASLGTRFVEATREQRGAYSGGRVGLAVEGEVRALFADYPSAPTRVPGILTPPEQDMTILDLITRAPISTRTVEWVAETTSPDAAAEVLVGALKPESEFDVELRTDSTKVIATWVNFGRQTIRDEAQLRSYIDLRLAYAVRRRLAQQVISGDGVGANMTGILNTAGISTYVEATAAQKAVVSIRKAKTVAELADYPATGVVVAPIDAEAIDLTSATDGTLLVAVQAQGTVRTLWGMTLVTSTALTGTNVGVAGGRFLVGGFREAAVLWERTGVELFLTDSHASNFTSNVLTLLAEIEALLTVMRPAAIVAGTFGASRT